MTYAKTLFLSLALLVIGGSVSAGTPTFREKALVACQGNTAIVLHPDGSPVLVSDPDDPSNIIVWCEGLRAKPSHQHHHARPKS